MANKKKARVLEELDGKTQQEKDSIIGKKIKSKEYSKRQFKTITNAFKDNPCTINVIIESLKTLKESANTLTERQEKAFYQACSVAEKTINNPNSTEEERKNAIKLINHCYNMLTAVIVVVIIAIVAAILYILAKVFGEKENN